MCTKNLIRRLASVFLAVMLCLSSIRVTPPSVYAAVPATDARPGTDSGLYRTTIKVRSDAGWSRLDAIGAVALERGDTRGLLLVDAEQLAALAGLGFEPRQTDDMAALLAAQGAAAGWLSSSLAPLLSGSGPSQRPPADLSSDQASALVAARAEVRAALHALPVESLVALAQLPTVDDDSDGLSNTEETWWCTNPNDADSDDDLVDDGHEVSQLLAGNRTNGKPFLGWPPNLVGCYDDDFDSLPDSAETNVIGLSINRESTDLDKYDDGQEFFGSTYCPGGPGSCGYGALPRTVDLYLGGTMPSFVQAPANSPWIAAFPDPAVTVVDGSLNVQAVTTITTDHTIGSGESHTYSTATTLGTSTSNVDLKTWNDWQEVKDESDASRQMLLSPKFSRAGIRPNGIDNWIVIGGETVAVMAALGAIAASACIASVVCGLVAVGLTVTAYGVTVVRELDDAGVFAPETVTPDAAQASSNPNRCSQAGPGTFTCVPDHVVDQQEQGLIDLGSAFSQYQDRPTSEGDTNYTWKPDTTLEATKAEQGEIPATSQQSNLANPGPVTHATESGGIKGTITTEYAETTITTAQEFSSSESWSEATAVDSAHAADLRFSYRILNDGTDILREMDGLQFNVYLGSNPNPIHTYNVIAQTGVLRNLQPGQAATFASDPVALTLQQMALVDQGASLYITVEYLSYGGDQLFFEDAVNGGVIVGIEDGWADGDDVFDLYVLPCFGSPCGADPNETVQTIVQRGFPTVEDSSGNLLAISTPEINGPVVDWVEHRLDYTSWWNVYLSDAIDYTGAFSTTRPLAGEAVVLRFLDDSDLDGFNDRTESLLGTDVEDPASHPTPELLAGTVSRRIGNDVSVTMAFLNTGVYDAAGVEVIAYAPDDTITIHDNTIGGSGRVPAGAQIVVGSRVRPPSLANWTGSAVPVAGGQFAGTVDTVYTLTAAASGSIGSGNLLLNWSDGSHNGQLQVGNGYLSPLPLPLGANGVWVSFNSGTVHAGDSFAVQARPAGDTISYTVDSEPHTPPRYVVSYNDPQGNHRFITPVAMAAITESLASYSGQMIPDLGLTITTDAPFDATGANTTYYIVNSPDTAPIQDAHLFVEYINDEGNTVAEQVFTQSLSPRPTVWPVSWDTSIFTETFTTAEDYTILALWTDSQGDIVDTAVRPLASFQADPLPRVAATEAAWDFGSVYVGQPLYREFTVANVGQAIMPVMAQTSIPSGTLVGDWRAALSPTESAAFGLKIDTSTPGTVAGAVMIRAADLSRPSITIPVSGEVLPLPNLMISNSDVAFSNGNPAAGESVTISATVHNTSTHPVQNVVVRFFSGEPLAGAPQIGADQVLPSIPAGGQATANASLSYASGHNVVHVTVDPDSVVPEVDEYDNDAKGFFHIETTLPPGGVLANGRVARIADPAALPSTVVITGSAALLLPDLTDTVASLLIGKDAILELDNTSLTVTSLSHSPVHPASAVVLRDGSGIVSSQPYQMSARRIAIFDSTLSSLGPDGIKPPNDGGPGTPGMPASIELNADSIVLLGSDVLVKGGNGGTGAFASGSAQSGGTGGFATAALVGVSEIALWSSQLEVRGGGGGTGGKSGGSDGGNGGPGAEANLVVSARRHDIRDSIVRAEGGAGGSGGEGNHAGGSGSAGATGRIDIAGEIAEARLTSLYAEGGSGGYGGRGDIDGRPGADGGAAEVDIETSHLHAYGLSTEATGGQGGGGGSGLQVGGSGGRGGNSNLTVLTSDIYATNVMFQAVAGQGGQGITANYGSGDLGGDGGAGGWSTTIITSEHFIADAMLISVIAGSGSNGGSVLGTNTSYRHEAGDGGVGGNGTLQFQATASATGVISTTLAAGNGGNGGTTAQSGQRFYSGNGGNGGNITLTGTTDSGWSNTGTAWHVSRGTGGTAQTGTYHPGIPGSPGTQSISLSEAYESHAPGKKLISLADVRPTLLNLLAPGGVSFHWNNNTPAPLPPPYETSVPATPGFNQLHAHYTYADSSTAESHHGFYVYGTATDYDGDGLLDTQEAMFYDTDPVLPDTDGDGLEDGAEIAAGTDPRNSDSDYDGILDGQDPDVLQDPDLHFVSTVGFSNPSPTEGDEVTLLTTVANHGSNHASGIVVAFFDGDPANIGIYLCSAFVADLLPSGSSSGNCLWNTTGVTGTHQIYAVVDPNNHIVETNEANNTTSAPITIRTKPDLRIQSLTPLAPEVIQGGSLEVAATVQNTGQTDASVHRIDFLDGATPFASVTISLPAGQVQQATATWSPTALGPHALLVRADAADVVAESNEANNEASVPAYVGFATPLAIDSGGPVDPEYGAAAGCGWLPSTVTVAWGPQPYQTARLSPAGGVAYRFDHLSASHFYHLDLTLFEGDSAGRAETIWIDSAQRAGPIDLSDGQPHGVSLLLPASSYQDHGIVAEVKGPQTAGAVVSELSLHDIFYCYRDSGGPGDPAYGAGATCGGYVDPASTVGSGSTPEESYRVDLTDNTMSYRFDGLVSSKRYQAHLTLYRPASNTVRERILIDGIDAGVLVDLSDRQPHRITVELPSESYRSDGSAVVTVRRVDTSSGAFVNEISLEEKTLLALPAIADVRVSNVSENSATLSWLTDKAANGEVHFGASPSLGQIAHDDRGMGTSSHTHHVTLSALAPLTTYFFYVASADAVDDNAGALYQFTTGPTLSPPASDLIYGRVFLPDGVTPAAGALVYITLRDANGQGTPGDAALLSYIVRTDDDGYWNVNLGNARTASLAQYFQYSPAGDHVHLVATNGSGCQAEQVVDTANDAEAPLMTLTCPTQVTHNLAIGWNLLGLNVFSDPTPLAEDALDDVEAQGGNASEIDRWLNGGWDAHIHNLPFNNYPLELGKGYFVKSMAVSAWQRTGRPSSNPLPVALSPGWNLIGVPRLAGTLSAEQLLDGIETQGGNCSEIDHWLNGGWNGHIHNLPFNNFTLRTDEGYFVKCSQASTYIPPLVEQIEADAWPAPVAMVALEPVANPAIGDVLVTNRRDVALTIVWRTDKSSDGWVEYGMTPELGQAAYDDRGEKVVSAVHHVTLTGLQPETTIFFRVHAGDSMLDQGGKPFEATTLPTAAPGEPVTIYGQALLEDGAPAAGALVIARLVDSAGAQSEPLSTVVDGWGYWAFDLLAADCTRVQMQVESVASDGIQTKGVYPACQDQVIPILTIPGPAFQDSRP